MRVLEKPNAALGRRDLMRWGAVLGAGAVLTACSTQTVAESDETPNASDIGFFTDMSAHHEQALAMCQRVLGRDTGAPVQTAAADILQAQAYERGIMFTWLQVWGESTAPPETVMEWMGMGVPLAEMPGLASATEMTALATATGLAKGRMFLELMRAHHVGGVHMADMAASMAGLENVRGLATRMSAVQSYEIEIFDTLLSSTYAEEHV